MNVLSLFDGISCGFPALERAGICVDNYFASEIDEPAMRISRANYPEIIQLGDVNNWREWDLPKIDLIMGGSPCQGFSRNGSMTNFKHIESQLLYVFVDIVEAYRKINPNVKFLLENVRMKKEWAAEIDRLLGVDHVMINSNTLSAQNRLRLYWSDIDFELPVDKGIKLLDILDDVEVETVERNGILFEDCYSENSMNLVSLVNGEVRVKQATKQGYIVAHNGDGVNLCFPTSKTRRGRVIKGKSPCLDCQNPMSCYHNGVIRRITIAEMEKLQTLPVGYTAGASYNASRFVLGNGWTVDVIAHILRHMC